MRGQSGAWRRPGAVRLRPCPSAAGGAGRSPRGARRAAVPRAAPCLPACLPARPPPAAAGAPRRESGGWGGLSGARLAIGRSLRKAPPTSVLPAVSLGGAAGPAGAQPPRARGPVRKWLLGRL